MVGLRQYNYGVASGGRAKNMVSKIRGGVMMIMEKKIERKRRNINWDKDNRLV